MKCVLAYQLKIVSVVGEWGLHVSGLSCRTNIGTDDDVEKQRGALGGKVRGVAGSNFSAKSNNFFWTKAFDPVTIGG